MQGVFLIFFYDLRFDGVEKVDLLQDLCAAGWVVLIDGIGGGVPGRLFAGTASL